MAPAATDESETDPDHPVVRPTPSRPRSMRHPVGFASPRPETGNRTRVRPNAHVYGRVSPGPYRLAGIAEPVGDRIAAVAAEVAGGHLDAGSRLAAFVFGRVQKLLHAFDRRPVVALGNHLGNRVFAFD